MEFPEPKSVTDVNGLTYRYAKPSDSAAFSKWALDNPKIPRKDILASLSGNNPTTVVLVVEKDGEPILFAPFYCQMNLAYLGFKPGSKSRERVKALDVLQWLIAQFAFDHGVREVTVQTSKDYPVGQWALKHGFKEEYRQTFVMRVTPLIDPDKKEEVNNV